MIRAEIILLVAEYLLLGRFGVVCILKVGLESGVEGRVFCLRATLKVPMGHLSVLIMLRLCAWVVPRTALGLLLSLPLRPRALAR